MFLDTVICEGLDYAMMSALSSCRLYTTTSTTTDPSQRRLSSSARALVSEWPILALLLLCLTQLVTTGHRRWTSESWELHFLSNFFEERKRLEVQTGDVKQLLTDHHIFGGDVMMTWPKYSPWRLKKMMRISSLSKDPSNVSDFAKMYKVGHFKVLFQSLEFYC